MCEKYRMDVRAGRIFHVAGTGESGYSGDGGPAKEAKLSGPKGIAWAPDGSLYLADTESHTIRRVDLKSGLITTVAVGSAATAGTGRSIGDSRRRRASGAGERD